MKKMFLLLFGFILITGSVVIIMFRNKNIIEIVDIKSMHFGYSTGTMVYSYVSYDLDYKDGKYIAVIKPNNVSDEEATTVEFKNEDVNKIKEILKKYNVQKWDGFNKSDQNVLDGNSFHLNVYFQNDTSISASGYMMYPNNYRKVVQEFDNIFLSYCESLD